MWKNGVKHGYGTYDLDSVGLRYEGFWMNVNFSDLSLANPRRTRSTVPVLLNIQMGHSFEASSPMTSLSQMTLVPSLQYAKPPPRPGPQRTGKALTHSSRTRVGNLRHRDWKTPNES